MGEGELTGFVETFFFTRRFDREVGRGKWFGWGEGGSRRPRRNSHVADLRWVGEQAHFYFTPLKALLLFQAKFHTNKFGTLDHKRRGGGGSALEHATSLHPTSPSRLRDAELQIIR